MCKNLLKAMLKIDELKRPTAMECLDFPFIRENEIKKFIDKSFIENCLLNYMTYSPDLKFHQAIMSYVVLHFFSQNEILEYKIFFDDLDIDKDGKLSHSEILNGFKKHLGLIKEKEKELVKITKKIDSDKSGSIEFQEFLLAVMRKDMILSDINIRKLFRIFDLDNGGSITSNEIKLFLGSSAKITEKNWNEIISQTEISNPMEITFEEFKHMMKMVFKKKS